MTDFSLALDLPPGFDSNDTTFASSDRWVDGNNVRFVDGRPRSVGGVANFLNGIFNAPRKLHAYLINSTVRVAIADEQSLFSVIVGGAMWNITPASWVGTGRSACFAMWGGTLLVNNSGGKLFQSVNGAVATHVTQAPAQMTAMLVTPERQVLAFGCNEEVSGTFNGMCIRGCDLEDLTDWSSTSTNNAFEHILEGVGSIVTARLIGPYVAVWTTTALYLGQFVGDPGQTYRFDRVADNCGCIGLDAVAVADQTAFWIGQDLQPRMWTPGGVPRIIPCPVSRDYLENCNTAQKAKIHAVVISKFNEVWFYYPDKRDGGTHCSRYIAYCIDESLAFQRPVWFRGERARAAALDSPLLAQDLNSRGTTVVGIPGMAASLAADECTDIGSVWFIQTGDRYLDNAARRVFIKRFVPDFVEAPSYFDLAFLVRDRPRKMSQTKGPYPVLFNTYKLDVRVSGMILALKFSGFGKILFGKPVLEGVVAGSR